MVKPLSGPEDSAGNVIDPDAYNVAPQDQLANSHHFSVRTYYDFNSKFSDGGTTLTGHTFGAEASMRFHPDGETSNLIGVDIGFGYLQRRFSGQNEYATDNRNVHALSGLMRINASFFNSHLTVGALLRPYIGWSTFTPVPATEVDGETIQEGPVHQSGLGNTVVPTMVVGGMAGLLLDWRFYRRFTLSLGALANVEAVETGNPGSARHGFWESGDLNFVFEGGLAYAIGDYKKVRTGGNCGKSGRQEAELPKVDDIAQAPAKAPSELDNTRNWLKDPANKEALAKFKKPEGILSARYLWVPIHDPKDGSPIKDWEQKVVIIMETPVCDLATGNTDPTHTIPTILVDEKGQYVTIATLERMMKKIRNIKITENEKEIHERYKDVEFNFSAYRPGLSYKDKAHKKMIGPDDLGDKPDQLVSKIQQLAAKADLEARSKTLQKLLTLKYMDQGSDSVAANDLAQSDVDGALAAATPGSDPFAALIAKVVVTESSNPDINSETNLKALLNKNGRAAQLDALANLLWPIMGNSKGEKKAPAEAKGKVVVREALRKLIAVVAQINKPDAPNLTFKLIGHATKDKYFDNTGLSARRAHLVRALMIALGVDQNKIEASGEGTVGNRQWVEMQMYRNGILIEEFDGSENLKRVKTESDDESDQHFLNALQFKKIEFTEGYAQAKDTHLAFNLKGDTWGQCKKIEGHNDDTVKPEVRNTSALLTEDEILQNLAKFQSQLGMTEGYYDDMNSKVANGEKAALKGLPHPSELGTTLLKLKTSLTNLKTHVAQISDAKVRASDDKAISTMLAKIAELDPKVETLKTAYAALMLGV